MTLAPLADDQALRQDLRLIAAMVPAKSRVLDIGCGNGALIAHLARTRQCDARGLELDMSEVTRAVAHGLPVMQGNADTDLVHYPDASFDFVILSRTLQAVSKPREVLRQMLRIGASAIVSFPNFGHWRVRWQLLVTGCMPMTRVWHRPWFETPNIHPCTLHDFFSLCEMDGHRVAEWFAVDDAGRQTPWRRFPRLANIFGEQVVFRLTSS